MKKLLTFLMLILSISAFSQQVNTANKGQYIILSFSTSDEITKVTRPTKINSKSGVIVVDTVFYVKRTSPLDTILTFTQPAGKKAAIVLERGGNWKGTITVSTNNLSYSSWGVGAKPIISGFTTITGWTNEGGGIYSKALTAQSNPEIVTIDGAQFAMGRTPNSDRFNPQAADYFHIDSYSDNNHLTDTEIPAATANWTGATIVYKTPAVNRWLKTAITNHTGNTLTFVSPGNGYEKNMGVGYGYFIQNDLRTLNTYGEWYYGGGKFYMYFGAVNPVTKTVKVSTINNLVNVNNKGFITIQNIAFEGANTDAITTPSTGTYNTTIKNCDFNLNQTGIRYGGRGYELSVSYCNFNNNSNQAIYSHWYSDGNYIGHNTINNTGLVVGVGSSTWYSGKAMTITYSRHDYSSKNTIVEYNTVTNSGFSGIHFGGDSIKVRYNYVDNYGLNKSDNGGIQYGDALASINMTVDHNIVLNSNMSTDKDAMPVGMSDNKQFMIYFDYRSNGGHKVTNNTVANSTANGIVISGSSNMTVTNNTIYNTQSGLKFLQFNPQTVYPIFTPVTDLIATGNKVIAKDITQAVLWARDTLNVFSTYGTINNNYYSAPIQNNSPFTTLVKDWFETKRNFDNWKSYTSQDANSYLTYNKKDSVIFDYNAGIKPKTVTFSGTYITADRVSHTGSVTLQPWQSIVLFKEAE